jgi:hypothetical protein
MIIFITSESHRGRSAVTGKSGSPIALTLVTLRRDLFLFYICFSPSFTFRVNLGFVFLGNFYFLIFNVIISI